MEEMMREEVGSFLGCPQWVEWVAVPGFSFWVLCKIQCFGVQGILEMRGER
jgi:hypothetical protein